VKTHKSVSCYDMKNRKRKIWTVSKEMGIAAKIQ